MTGIDRTPYCAAPACDLNLAGWAHVPWDCDTPLPAPTLTAETVASLPVWRRPWVQGSARAFARLNPGACPPRQPGAELPGEPAADPSQRANLRDQEATATLGERTAAGLRAENLPADPARRRAGCPLRRRGAPPGRDHPDAAGPRSRRARGPVRRARRDPGGALPPPVR